MADGLRAPVRAGDAGRRGVSGGVVHIDHDPENGDYSMNLQQIPLISIVLFFPLLGAVILFFVKKEDTELIKRFSLVWTILTFVLSLVFVIGFRYGDPGFQFDESL